MGVLVPVAKQKLDWIGPSSTIDTICHGSKFHIIFVLFQHRCHSWECSGLCRAYRVMAAVCHDPSTLLVDGQLTVLGKGVLGGCNITLMAGTGPIIHCIMCME
jgi:hypothetical protein